MSRLRLLALAVAALALGAAGILGAVGLAGASSGATSLDGKWRGEHLYQIAGSLEGGFSISAGESWMIFGCPISAGTVLSRYTPKGGSSYAAEYLWTESESQQGGGVKCTNSYRNSETHTVTLSGASTLTISCGGFALCGTLTRVGPPPTTTTRPASTKPPTTTAPKPATTTPKPKPKPKPKPPPKRDTGYLELALVLRPSGTTSRLPFEVCVKRIGGDTLCYRLRGGRALVLSNRGKRLEWPVGAQLEICLAKAYAGWATPSCRRVTIGKGRNRQTVVLRRDVTPPTVKAFPKPGLTKPGTRGPLEYSVADDSGAATLHATLYEGGTTVKENAWKVKANGKRQRLNTLFAADLIGPLYFCVWAEDAAGNRSAKAPESSCAWISLLAPIEKVSNGCGGGGWDVLEWAQNYFGNEHTYQNSNVNPLALEYDVNFKAACDIHDAGYGGHTVRDTINGGTIDFRTWSRPRVDDKFLADMRLLCERAIPAKAKVARANCKARGGNVSIGAELLYNFVNKQGWRFYDADLTTPGIQKRGERCQFRPCADE